MTLSNDLRRICNSLLEGEDDEFQDSDSFSRDDLLQVAYVAQQAFDYILDASEEEDE